MNLTITPWHIGALVLVLCGFAWLCIELGWACSRRQIEVLKRERAAAVARLPKRGTRGQFVAKSSVPAKST